MDIFPIRVLELTIALSIFFEIVKGMIVSNNTPEKIKNNVYQRAVETINHEIISFASFSRSLFKEV